MSKKTITLGHFGVGKSSTWGECHSFPRIHFL